MQHHIATIRWRCSDNRCSRCTALVQAIYQSHRVNSCRAETSVCRRTLCSRNFGPGSASPKCFQCQKPSCAANAFDVLILLLPSFPIVRRQARRRSLRISPLLKVLFPVNLKYTFLDQLEYKLCKIAFAIIKMDKYPDSANYARNRNRAAPNSYVTDGAALLR